jgi:hypothetical protein
MNDINPQSLSQSPRPGSRRSAGQVLVVFAISLLALLFFIGLALDAGIVYVNYGQLKRAVDAGSVAAANNFKQGASNEEMYAAVLEVLKLQNVNVDPAALNLVVTTCDMNNDGWQDDNLAHPGPEPLPADFAPLCPQTDPTDASLMAPSARKLVFVGANQRTPLYFLSLLGIGSVNLNTSSIAEAAAVDLVLVIDTSESMGNATTSPVDYDTNKFDFDPSTCNAHTDGSGFHPSTCYPLRNAIDAAQNLVDTLYAGYDNIALITYDTVARPPGENSSFHLTSLVGGNLDAVKQKIAETQLHDDAPYWNPPNSRLRPLWYTDFTSGSGRINPSNMEDRDGNGQDADAGKPCWVSRTPSPTELDDHWDDVLNVPCDLDGKNDAYDWNANGIFDDSTNPPTVAPFDTDLGATWLDNNNLELNAHDTTYSIVSTCTGCGIRAASNELRNNGRPGAVWVIVLLSDGLVNMSDTYTTLGGASQDPVIIPASYPNGFCTQRFWSGFCTDGRLQNKGPAPAGYPDNPYRKRYCLDKAEPPSTLADSATCAPGSIWEARVPANSNYSSFDYALDMVDEAALRVNNTLDPLLTGRYNTKEPTGNDIAIYSIGMGPAVAQGVPLLRYMAAVGDDGDRVTDPCLDSGGTIYTFTKSCGQYYYAAGGAQLRPIFDSIASRIYTKIAH